MPKTVMPSYMSSNEQTYQFNKADRERSIIRRGVLNRKVSTHLRKGKVVYCYIGDTDGVIGIGGVAVTDRRGKLPYYEVPRDAVKWDYERR